MQTAQTGTVSLADDTLRLLLRPTSDGNLILEGCEGSAPCLSVPSTVGGMPVTEIAPEAFAYATQLEEIELPDSIEVIGEKSFVGSGITRIRLPRSVRRIGRRAFSNCHRLERVELNEGLVEIGHEAFASCENLGAILLPSTVKKLQLDSFEKSGALQNGTIGIEKANETYALDEHGVLYQRCPEGWKLLRAFRPLSGTYRIVPGTVTICEGSCSHMTDLERVVLPEGLTRIEKNAFSHCSSLKHVLTPRSLSWIGEGAFYRTDLELLELPAALEHIGTYALLLKNEDIRDSSSLPCGRMSLTGITPWNPPKTRDDTCAVTVDEGNERFCVVSDFLCERLPGDKLLAHKYVGTGTKVTIPRQITRVAEGALVSACHARELVVHDGIEHVGFNGLYLTHPLLSISINIASSPVACELYPPQNFYGVWAQSRAQSSGILDIPMLVQDCDDTMNRCIEGYGRTWRIVSRLAHPYLLSEGLKEKFEEEVAQALLEIVCAFSERNHLVGLEHLLDLGFIDRTNIGACIDAAGSVHGVAACGLLLDEQHRRFTRTRLDLEL
ncbi:MAG: leucine-rich repeat domain-containing protein [Coriobacteriales bacterium]